MEAIYRSTLILGAVVAGGLMLGLSVLFSLSVLGRKRELAVLRAMGASTSFVRRILLMENSVIGLLGGAAAIAAYGLYALAAEPSAALPEWGIPAGLGAGAAGILASTWLPATMLSRRDPTRYMRG